MVRCSFFIYIKAHDFSTNTHKKIQKPKLFSLVCVWICTYMGPLKAPCTNFPFLMNCMFLLIHCVSCVPSLHPCQAHLTYLDAHHFIKHSVPFYFYLCLVFLYLKFSFPPSYFYSVMTFPNILFNFISFSPENSTPFFLTMLFS